MKSALAKPLHEVAGLSLLGHALRSTAALGAVRSVVVTAPGADAVVAAARRACPEVEFAEQAERLGTGHAVRMAEDALAGFEGDAIALFADTPFVAPDTLAKIMLTSGSTSKPKGVLTTHKMICVNQAQMSAAMPFLKERPPLILDWLPWNHTFGGTHNFNMMLANGGALYVDGGKPAPGLIETSIENLRLNGDVEMEKRMPVLQGIRKLPVAWDA